MKLTADMLCHGVYIVGATHEGKASALAVAWATQVATDTVLIVVGKQSYTRDLITDSGAFGLSMLEEGQQELGRHFGRQSGRSVDKLAGIEIETHETGSPILKDCALWLDCKVIHVFGVGSTKVIVGRIVAAGRNKESFTPLIYRGQDY